jgi:hypothetical protein
LDQLDQQAGHKDRKDHKVSQDRKGHKDHRVHLARKV